MREVPGSIPGAALCGAVAVRARVLFIWCVAGRACRASAVLPRGASCGASAAPLDFALVLRCVCTRCRKQRVMRRFVWFSRAVSDAARYAVLRTEALRSLGLCWELGMKSFSHSEDAVVTIGCLV